MIPTAEEILNKLLKGESVTFIRNEKVLEELAAAISKDNVQCEIDVEVHSIFMTLIPNKDEN